MFVYNTKMLIRNTCMFCRWPKEDPSHNFQEELEEAWELLDTVGENLASGVPNPKPSNPLV